MIQSTTFFASSGKIPSRANETTSCGERMPESESIFGQLAPRVHVNDRPRYHADLAHPVERAHMQRREPHRQVDQEEREQRYQSQRKEIEGTLLRDSGVDRLQPLAEACLNGISEQESRREKRKRGAKRRGKRHEHRSPQQAENRAAGKRQRRRAGQRQTGDDHVQDEIRARGAPWMRVAIGDDAGLLRLERVQHQVALEIEGEERGDRDRHPRQNQHARFRHGAHTCCIVLCAARQPPAARCENAGPPTMEILEVSTRRDA